MPQGESPFSRGKLTGRRARWERNTPIKPHLKRDEVLGYVKQAAGQAGNSIMENNFWGLSCYTLIMPELLKNASFALPQADFMGPGWNYIDAACQGIVALQQLFDKATHRPHITKAKGLVNLASSIQLVALTAIGSTTLGPIAFATGTGVCLLLALDENIRQMRRLYSSEYFLVDSLKELDKIEALIDEKDKFFEEVQKLRQLRPKEFDNPLTQQTIKLANTTKEKLILKRFELQKQIEAKLEVDLYENRHKPEGGPLSQIVMGYKNKGNISHQKCEAFFLALQDKTSDYPKKENPYYAYIQAKAVDRRTTKVTRLALMASVSDTVVWGLAFAGMVMLCLPGMQPLAVALIAASCALIVSKKLGKFAAKKIPPLNRFFQPPWVGEKPPEPEPAPQLQPRPEAEDSDFEGEPGQPPRPPAFDSNDDEDEENKHGEEAPRGKTLGPGSTGA